MEDAVDQEVAVPGDHTGLWARHAETWEHVRPPLRPSRNDIRIYEELVDDLIGHHKMPRVLLLGCTPELLLMKWPLDTRISCLEQSPAMAERVYGKTAAYMSEDVHARMKIGNWFEAAAILGEAQFDLVIGDGCYTQLAADEYAGLGQQIALVMSQEASFVHRFFVKTHDEDPELVLASLMTPFIYESFSDFKLRFLLSKQSSFEEGVRLGDVYEHWHRFNVAASFTGVKPQHYSARERDTIEHYRGSEKRYSFPSGKNIEITKAVAPLLLARSYRPTYAEAAIYSRFVTMRAERTA